MTTRKVFFGAVVAATVAIGGTVAYGYFTAGPASGVGQGRTAVFQGLTNVELDATVSGLLVPGGTGDLVLSVHNDNAFPITFTVAPNADPPLPVTPEDCAPATVLQLDIPTLQEVARVGANDDVIVTLAGAVTMKPDAPSECQGATFTIPVTALAEVAR